MKLCTLYGAISSNFVHSFRKCFENQYGGFVDDWLSHVGVSVNPVNASVRLRKFIRA